MRHITAIVLLGLVLSAPAHGQEKLNVFACEPEWGALAGIIGGARVDVYTASTAQQNAHYLRAKPSLLAEMRKADLVFCTGAALEIGWLPVLVQKAGGPDVQPETIGWLMAADYVEKLGVMDHADRSMGHVHPEGNPHIHLDPRNVAVVAGMLAERLILLDPDNTAAYQENLSAFGAAWTDSISRWKAQAGVLEGAKVIVYHDSWTYLLHWLGMDIAAELEPKPGLPPTAAHLESVLESVRGGNVKAILVAPFEDEDAAQWLSDKTGIPILRLPFTVGGNGRAQDLESLFSETLRMLQEDAP